MRTAFLLLALALSGCLGAAPGTDEADERDRSTEPLDAAPAAEAPVETVTATPPPPRVLELRYEQGAAVEGLYVGRGGDYHFNLLGRTPWLAEVTWDVANPTLERVRFVFLESGERTTVEGSPPLRLELPNGSLGNEVTLYAEGMEAFVGLQATVYVSVFEDGPFDPAWSALA